MNKPLKVYTLRATTVGNPDYGQDPSRRMYGVPNLNAEVTARTLNQVLDDWTGEYEIGGGNIHNCFLYDGKKIVAQVSYNGRVWPNKEWVRGRQELKVNEEGVFYG